MLLAGAAFLYTSVRVGGHLSRQLSRPIEELIGWTGHIQRMEPLPPDRPRRGAPEFEALRQALREMASAIEQGRAREIEAERLRAFRETARRVAHEMRNPLTPIRLAVAQLARSSAAPRSRRRSTCWSRSPTGSSSSPASSPSSAGCPRVPRRRSTSASC